MNINFIITHQHQIKIILLFRLYLKSILKVKLKGKGRYVETLISSSFVDSDLSKIGTHNRNISRGRRKKIPKERVESGGSLCRNTFEWQKIRFKQRQILAILIQTWCWPGHQMLGRGSCSTLNRPDSKPHMSTWNCLRRSSNFSSIFTNLPKGAGGMIPPKATLMFEVELISFRWF